MKRFRSRVESLRRLRQQTEKLARLSAAVCQGEKMKADQEVERIHREREQLSQQALHQLGHDVSPTMLASLMSSMSMTESLLVQSKQRQQQAESVLAEAIAETARAKADTRIVEKYREREFTVHRRHQLVQEEHTRLETTSGRYSRAKVDCQRLEAQNETSAIADCFEKPKASPTKDEVRS